MKYVNGNKWFISLMAALALLAAAAPGVMADDAGRPSIKNSAELEIAIRKLAVTGSVLYIAAHPDDENTAVLAYLSSERLLRAGYLSLTRGDGGQNLIGSEKGPLMGVLRTHELLRARHIDGAEQFFTRAIDFGYSKTAEESIAIWDKEKVLEDIVFVIRKFQPDLIISRFAPDSEGHGHHSASALLAREAFEASGDPLRFPEQLAFVAPWRAKRLCWNTWKPYQKNAKAEETEKLCRLDVGAYNALLGRSYHEIASMSRTMHKSQGFGAIPRRGSWLDYFEVIAGDPAQHDPLEGIDTSWSRIPGAQSLLATLNHAIRLYDPKNPSLILPSLLDALSILHTLPPSRLTRLKEKELLECIRSAGGLWLEALADRFSASPGQNLEITATAINRAGFPWTLKQLILPGDLPPVDINTKLETNKPLTRTFPLTISETAFTHPYWLWEKPGPGIYPAGDLTVRGEAVCPYPIQIKMVLATDDGREAILTAPVLFRWRDEVEGEKLREITITPPVTANFREESLYFPNHLPRAIAITLRCGPAPAQGLMTLQLPEGWSASPAQTQFKLDTPGLEKQIVITLAPPARDSRGELRVFLTVNGQTYDRSFLELNYPHLPIITLHPQASLQLVSAKLRHNGKRIGYIMGSGDDIPIYLEQAGYQVDLLSDQALREFDPSPYHAIITGVRAFNTRDILRHVHNRLLEYVEKGGRLIVQYTIADAFFSREAAVASVGPYPLKLSRERVTMEDAPITLLQPAHPVFQKPNLIQPADFNGWVQERGLYFAGEWDPRYTPLIACSDKGQQPLNGALIYAAHGKGQFIYTGLAFFRQIPAGVPGAMKLFLNLISRNQ